MPGHLDVEKHTILLRVTFLLFLILQLEYYICMFLKLSIKASYIFYKFYMENKVLQSICVHLGFFGVFLRRFGSGRVALNLSKIP
jgi:hypothetical protein